MSCRISREGDAVHLRGLVVVHHLALGQAPLQVFIVVQGVGRQLDICGGGGDKGCKWVWVLVLVFIEDWRRSGKFKLGAL